MLIKSDKAAEILGDVLQVSGKIQDVAVSGNTVAFKLSQIVPSAPGIEEIITDEFDFIVRKKHKKGSE